MPSTEVKNLPRLLDLGNNRRDWFSEFPEESALTTESPRREAKTLFAVVPHGRPVQIDVQEAPKAAEISQTPAFRLLSLIERVKRAFSPSLTALLIIYVAAIWMTASIGLNRHPGGKASQAAEAAVTNPVVLVRPAA